MSFFAQNRGHQTRTTQSLKVAAALACTLTISVALAAPMASDTAPAFTISDSALKAIDAGIAQATQKRQAVAKSTQAERATQKIHPLVDQLMTSPIGPQNADQRISVTVHVSDRAVLEQIKIAPDMGVVESFSAVEDSARVRVNANELAKLSKAAGVLSVRPVMREAKGHNVGSVLSQGDALLKASTARAQFGVNGSGKSICVISDGVTSRATAQAGGDLPAALEVCPQSPGQGDEGTAMLEIVHDLAPGAKLSFCSAQDNFLDAIAWSITQANGGKGCDVVVDDFFDLTEPRFQISDESELINRASRERGVTYVSSAGNFANNNYRQFFRDADPSGRGANAGLHDFGVVAGQASNVGFPILVAPGGRSAVFLQWSEPYGKAASDFVMTPVLQGGAPIDGPGSPFTLDLASDLVQDGTGFPLEAVVVSNKTSEVQAYFMLVKRKTGRGLVEISMLNNGNLGSVFATNFRTADGSIYGHSGAEKTISVAAVDASDPGLDMIESFSSRGLVRTYFNNAGDRRFDVQLKPDITATDGVSVTGAGGFPSTFFGTSASAPHVAAIAALIKNRNANADVGNVLRFSALDRGTPGVDTTWGFGLVDTQRALQLAPFLSSFSFGKSSADGKSFAESVRESSRQRAAEEAANYGQFK